MDTIKSYLVVVKVGRKLYDVELRASSETRARMRARVQLVMLFRVSDPSKVTTLSCEHLEPYDDPLYTMGVDAITADLRSQ